MDLLYFVVVHCPYICCIWSTLSGSAVLFPSDSGHSVNTISAPGAAMLSVSARLYHQLVSAESVSGQRASQFLI